LPTRSGTRASPDQEDGSYELRIPYGRPDELILDFLKLGPEAEVLEPAALREEVGRRLREAAGVYELRGGRRRLGGATLTVPATFCGSGKLVTVTNRRLETGPRRDNYRSADLSCCGKVSDRVRSC